MTTTEKREHRAAASRERWAKRRPLTQHAIVLAERFCFVV